MERTLERLSALVAGDGVADNPDAHLTLGCGRPGQPVPPHATVGPSQAPRHRASRRDRPCRTSLLASSGSRSSLYGSTASMTSSLPTTRSSATSPRSPGSSSSCYSPTSGPSCGCASAGPASRAKGLKFDQLRHPRRRRRGCRSSRCPSLDHLHPVVREREELARLRMMQAQLQRRENELRQRGFGDSSESSRDRLTRRATGCSDRRLEGHHLADALRPRQRDRPVLRTGRPGATGVVPERVGIDTRHHGSAHRRAGAPTGGCRPRPARPRAQCHPRGSLHDGAVRRGCARAPRRRGVVDVSRRRGELRRHGGPGAGRDRAGPGRAPCPGVHVAGRRRGLVVSAARAGRACHRADVAEISRQLLDSRFTARVVGDAPRGPACSSIMARAQRGADESDEVRRGEAEQLEARRHHDVWDATRDRITCPTFVAAGRFDGIAPVANSEAIVSRIAGATLHVYEGGHAFFAQDRRGAARDHRLPGPIADRVTTTRAWTPR